MKEAHQRAIEEKDAAIALLNDDLQKREYENVALQAQKDDMSYKNVIIPSHILNTLCSSCKKYWQREYYQHCTETCNTC